MRLSRHMRIVLLAFTGLFLATKLLGLHVLAHKSEQTSVDQCEICHVITSDLQYSAQAEEPAVDFQPLPKFTLKKDVPIRYAFAHSDDTLEYNLFSRPPPVI